METLPQTSASGTVERLRSGSGELLLVGHRGGREAWHVERITLVSQLRHFLDSEAYVHRIVAPAVSYTQR